MTETEIILAAMLAYVLLIRWLENLEWKQKLKNLKCLHEIDTDYYEGINKVQDEFKNSLLATIKDLEARNFELRKALLKADTLTDPYEIADTLLPIIPKK